MDSDLLSKCSNLVPASYIQQADELCSSKKNFISVLLEHQKLPDKGWNEQMIESLLSELSKLDSNNSLSNCGAGEREGRIYSNLVSRRHFRFSHGVGRSGDVTAVQPKAIGSSILNQLCTKLILDLIRQTGAKSTASCIIVPMATGMSLMLCFLALRSMRPDAKFIIWPRIDQKSCFKSMVSAGFIPKVVENLIEGDEIRTDLSTIKQLITDLGSENILCVHSTTSCFSPRGPDKLEEIAVMCKENDIPHIVNNAYGLQSSKCMHLLQQSARIGRVDAFVQSCDKNFQVPVGGAIVAGFGQNDFLEKVAGTYAGRGSGSPATDLLITCLEMGSNGLKKLLNDRKENFKYLKEEMKKLAERHNEEVLHTPNNQISIAMSLNGFSHDERICTELGSMLFTRQVSGARVVTSKVVKEIENYRFHGYGSHCNSYKCPYLTVAAAVGMTKNECDVLIKRIDKTMVSLTKKNSRNESINK